MGKNKVKFNLKNVHWAKLTFPNGVPEFGPWHAWPGAVSLSMDPEGETTPFHADGIVYYQSAANNGYSGEFESALVPEDFRQEILHEELDDNGVLIERADVETEHFALGYQVDGDQQGDLCVLYNNTIARPGLGGSTIEGSKEPQTDSVTITSLPMPDTMRIKARTSSKTSPAAYGSWWDKVYYGEAVEATADLMALTIEGAALTPAFDPAATVYTASTPAASGRITATPYGGAAVSVTVNGAALAEDGTAAWKASANIVNIVVTGGDKSKVYLITVTKTGA